MGDRRARTAERDHLQELRRTNRRSGPKRRTMSDGLATWIIVSNGECRRMLYVDGRNGQLHRVFEEADEVWRRMQVTEVLAELMLVPDRDRVILVANPEELDRLERSLDERTRKLVGLKVDRDLSRVADPLVVHIVREMLLDPTAKRTLPVNPYIAPGLRMSACETTIG
jgi:hypothetical protein